jgi:hypothetical protein
MMVIVATVDVAVTAVVVVISDEWQVDVGGDCYPCCSHDTHPLLNSGNAGCLS